MRSWHGTVLSPRFLLAIGEGLSRVMSGVDILP